MCKSPRDLNFALSSSFNLLTISFEGGLELDLDSLIIGTTTIDSTTSTTSISGNRRSDIFCSGIGCSSVALSETFKISFSDSASLVALIVMVFLLLDFLGSIGLDLAESELVRLPSEKRPESAPPVAKF